MRALPGARWPDSPDWRLLFWPGVFLQVSGLLLNRDGSQYATQLYLALFLPALPLLASRWRDALTPWRQRAAVPLALLIGWVMVRGVGGAGADHDALYWLKVPLLVFLYVTAVAHLTGHDRARQALLWATTGVAAGAAWLTLLRQIVLSDRPLTYDYLRQDGRLHDLGWLGFADLTHPVVAGLYLGFFVAICTYLLLLRPYRTTTYLALAIAMAGLLTYVLLTFSRGAWFATGCAGLALLLLFPGHLSRALLAVGVLALLAMPVLFWPELQHEWFLGTSQRDMIWLGWLAKLPEFWLAGAGAGRELVYVYPWGDVVLHAHSLYLQLWYEFGLPGIALLLWLLVELLRKAWRLRADPAARLGLALVLYASAGMLTDVHAIFHRPSHYWVLLWLPTGLVLGLKGPPGRASA